MKIGSHEVDADGFVIQDRNLANGGLQHDNIPEDQILRSMAFMKAFYEPTKSKPRSFFTKNRISSFYNKHVDEVIYRGEVYKRGTNWYGTTFFSEDGKEIWCYILAGARDIAALKLKFPVVNVDTLGGRQPTFQVKLKSQKQLTANDRYRVNLDLLTVEHL